MSIDVTEFLSIRFRDKGRSFSGCDCRGLVGLILKTKFGVDMPDADVSCRSKVEVDSAIRENNDWKRLSAPIEPCVILFCTERSDQIDHMGLYIGSNEFIHINSGLVRPQITSIEDEIWRYLIEGYYYVN